MSPTMVREPLRLRREIMRSSIGERILGFVHADVAIGADGVLGTVRRPVSQPGSGFVEQRHILEAPHHLIGVTAARTMQQLDLGRAEPTGRGRPQQSLRSEEIVEEVGGAEHRPHPFQRLPDLQSVAKLLANRPPGRPGGECWRPRPRTAPSPPAHGPNCGYGIGAGLRPRFEPTPPPSPGSVEPRARQPDPGAMGACRSRTALASTVTI